MMSRRRLTVADLAEEADLDLDEAIVTLWDAGFDDIDDPQDTLTVARATLARRALGVAVPRQLTTPDYWRSVLQMDPDAFEQLMKQLDIPMAPRARRLPKGAIRKLKRVTRERLGDSAATVSMQVDAEPPTLPPVEWEPIGHEQPMRYLVPEEVAGIHACLEEDFAGSDDPIEPPGVRDKNLLDSAVFRPMTSIGDTLKYPTVEMAAGALLHSLALNHPFHNGNKRTALVAMLVFLDENGMDVRCPEKDLFRLVLVVAQHRLVPRGADDLSDREVLEIARWLKKHVRRSEHGERVLKWVRLRRILTAFKCWTEFPTVGNRIDIYRKVNVSRRLGRPRSMTLRSQVYYGGDGTEVERNTVSKLRKELHLDDEHGVDSHSFYAMEIRSAEDFIVTYRKTLGRLAKL